MICPDCERPVATPTAMTLVGGDTCQAGLVPWLPAVIADCQRHTIARLTAELAEARKTRWVDFCGNSLLLHDGYAVAEVKHGDPGTVYWSANLAKPWARVATEAEAKDAAERAAGV